MITHRATDNPNNPAVGFAILSSAIMHVITTGEAVQWFGLSSFRVTKRDGFISFTTEGETFSMDRDESLVYVQRAKALADKLGFTGKEAEFMRFEAALHGRISRS